MQNPKCIYKKKFKPLKYFVGINFSVNPVNNKSKTQQIEPFFLFLNKIIKKLKKVFEVQI